MKKVFLALFAFAAVHSTPALALNGSISFTAAEVRAHENALPVIMDVASNCLKSDLARHNSYMRQYGVSAFYGENSTFAKSSRESKVEQLRRKGLPAAWVADYQGIPLSG